jgi:peptide deformylase
MSILKVARMGHPVLRAKARPIEKAEIRGAAIQTLIDDMLHTMAEYHGVGLAAPQVHESVRLFVAALDHHDDDDDDDDDDRDDADRERPEKEPVAIINPEILVVGSDVIEDWEGCLSIPDIRGRVVRAHGFPARVVQHETDHLDGVLFVDRMRSFESLTFLDEYSRYWIKD